MHEAENAREQPDYFSSRSSSTTTTHSRIGIHGSPADKTSYKKTETVVARSTPVLFCTCRGLHLRLAKPSTAADAETTLIDCTSNSKANQLKHFEAYKIYDFKFCDLERWSTVRANAINLEDRNTLRTFTVQQSSRSIPKKHSVVGFNTSLSLLEDH